MNYFSGLLLLLVASVPFLLATSPPEYECQGEGAHIRQSDDDGGIDPRSSLGRVHGVRPCGGPGRVTEWRFEDCYSDSICRVPVEQVRSSEQDFIPSRNIDQLGLRIRMFDNGTARTIYEKALDNSGVQAGALYTSNSGLLVGRKYKGRRVTFQYSLYRVSDASVETCVEADFEIV